MDALNADQSLDYFLIALVEKARLKDVMYMLLMDIAKLVKNQSTLNTLDFVFLLVVQNYLHKVNATNVIVNLDSKFLLMDTVEYQIV